MVSSSVQKNLGFVFQPAESPRVDDSITVTLVMRPPEWGFLFEFAAFGLGTELGVRSQNGLFPTLQFKTGAGHERENEWF
jgi:hypothetical protein